MFVALRDAGDALPAAAAVMSPWADLGLTGASVTTKAGVDPALTADGLRRRAADYAPDADLTAPTISPVHARLHGLPPLLIQAGSHEILLDDALRLAASAARDDVDVTLSVTRGVPHVFQGFAGVLEEGAQALDQMGSFLRRHLVS
jgi:monoterpene epsilon-lactone hydrolase